MLADDLLPSTLPQWMLGGGAIAVCMAVSMAITYFFTRAWPMISEWWLKRQGIESKEKSDRRTSDDNLYREGFERADTAKSEELARAYRVIDELQEVNESALARLASCRENAAAYRTAGSYLEASYKRLQEAYAATGGDSGPVIELPKWVEVNDESLKHRALGASQSAILVKAVNEIGANNP